MRVGGADEIVGEVDIAGVETVRACSVSEAGVQFVCGLGPEEGEVFRVRVFAGGAAAAGIAAGSSPFAACASVSCAGLAVFGLAAAFEFFGGCGVDLCWRRRDLAGNPLKRRKRAVETWIMYLGHLAISPVLWHLMSVSEWHPIGIFSELVPILFGHGFDVIFYVLRHWHTCQIIAYPRSHAVCKFTGHGFVDEARIRGWVGGINPAGVLINFEGGGGEICVG
jgi:hypothetical protein